MKEWESVDGVFMDKGDLAGGDVKLLGKAPLRRCRYCWDLRREEPTVRQYPRAVWGCVWREGLGCFGGWPEPRSCHAVREGEAEQDGVSKRQVWCEGPGDEGGLDFIWNVLGSQWSCLNKGVMWLDFSFTLATLWRQVRKWQDWRQEASSRWEVMPAGCHIWGRNGCDS